MSNPHRAPNLEALHWAEAAGLVELWRWKHPAERCNSYLSLVHASSSKIDMAFANVDLLPLASETTYLPGGVSDHTPLQINLQLGPHGSRRAWRLSAGWVGGHTVDKVLNPHIESYWQINEV